MNPARRFLLVGLFVFNLAHAQENIPGQEADSFEASTAGRYQVSFRSELEPIAINRIHNWVLHIETSQGQLVDDAEITVTGSMPGHNHGLPTNPQMTHYLGDGDYLIEGMRFHMNGSWQVTFTISERSDSDTVTFELEL